MLISSRNRARAGPTRNSPASVKRRHQIESCCGGDGMSHVVGGDKFRELVG